MKRWIRITTIAALVVTAGCLPTREQYPFGEGGEDDAGNNGVADGGNNGVDDAGGDNNGVPDAANNGIPDAGNNNGLPDTGGDPDMGVDPPDTGGDPDMGVDPPDMNMCTPESNQAFCDRLSARCGQLTDTDNCMMQRTVDCGTCPGNQPCDNNVCGMCNPESAQQFCDRLGAECGQLTAMDNCRMQRTENCGGCNADGVGCNSTNTCQEINCRDGADNDGAGGADCADSACLGRQCSNSPQKVCQADQSCN